MMKKTLKFALVIATALGAYALVEGLDAARKQILAPGLAAITTGVIVLYTIGK